MPNERAFHFTSNGQNFGAPARTLREFAHMLVLLPAEALEAHAKRSDFSNWIAKVFGDQPLAAAICKVEENLREGGLPNLSQALIKPIRDRYDLSE